MEVNITDLLPQTNPNYVLSILMKIGKNATVNAQVLYIRHNTYKKILKTQPKRILGNRIVAHVTVPGLDNSLYSTVLVIRNTSLFLRKFAKKHRKLFINIEW